jgi:glycosyltransferase involved in cell wall biosynthesis
MPELLVFIPAWNEAPSLPGVLEELANVLPEADVLVVDDGSTDATPDIARAHGAELLSFQQNQGLRAAIAAGYSYADQHGYQLCGRVDGDGQHPAAELARLLNEVRADRCDVAVGSRFVSGEGFENQRYRLQGVRRVGTSVMRGAMRTLLRHPFHDPMSGMYAANRKVIPLLARPYTSEAPEVEALMRISEAGLRLEEVPVQMRERTAGESKLRGRKAVGVVMTVGAALWMGRRLMLRARKEDAGS